MKNFIEKRLVDQTIDFYEPIKRLSLGTFSSLKKVKVKSYNKVIQFSAQNNIFARISLIQQKRKINLQKVFPYPLGPIPWALPEANGKLKKSSKAKIMHKLEKGVTSVERVDAPFVPIFDGMALVRMVKCTGLTYNQFADDLLKLVVAKSCRSKQMDVVFDVYRENSIKNAERGNRSTGQIQFNVIVGSTKITQWGTFLSKNKNKSQLIRFLVSRWKSQCSAIRESKLYVSFDEECVCIQSNGLCEPVEALGCNHEKADTRILLHANHLCQSTENVVIHTPDTDVLLIAITASGQISGSLFIRTGTKNKARIIPIDKVN